MKKILTVDDNELVRESLSERLERSRYTTQTAEHGYAGLTTLASFRSDVVLSSLPLSRHQSQNDSPYCREFFPRT